MHFELPDIADFPENVEPVNDTDYRFRDFGDLPGLVDHVRTFLDYRHDDILNAQLSRIVAAHNAYQSSPRPKTELTHTKIDTEELKDFFADDIAELQQTEVVRKGVKYVDRATVRTDGAAVEIVTRSLGQMATGHVKSVTVHISRPDDQHHLQQFYDCKTVTKLLNLHMDPKPGVTKAIIYLNDVTRENGPFQAIPNSIEWEYPDRDRIFGWGNSIGNYCHTARHRRVANAFPTGYRCNAIVGRLIRDGGVGSGFLLSKLISYTSDIANCIVFDPCYMLHRGGLCKSGERINLQVVMK